MMMSMNDPFAPRQMWAPHPREGIVVGGAVRYQIHRVGCSGDTILAMVYELVPGGAGD